MENRNEKLNKVAKITVYFRIMKVVATIAAAILSAVLYYSTRNENRNISNNKNAIET